MSTRANDRDLAYWNNLRKGSKTALFELYNHYYEDLYHYGLKISADDSITRDVIQDLFYALWTKRKGFPEVGSVRPYLIRMMRNMLLDQLKKHAMNTRFDHEDLLGERVQFSPEDLIISSETAIAQKAAIADSINALPARQKEVLLLRFYNRYSYKEIEEITGLGYQGLRNTMTRALRNLKKNLMLKVTL